MFVSEDTRANVQMDNQLLTQAENLIGKHRSELFD